MKERKRNKNRIKLCTRAKYIQTHKNVFLGAVTFLSRKIYRISRMIKICRIKKEKNISDNFNTFISSQNKIYMVF